MPAPRDHRTESYMSVTFLTTPPPRRHCAKLNVTSIRPPLLTPEACRPSPNCEQQASGGRDLYRRRNPQARRLFLPQAIPSVPSVPKLWARLPPKDSERTESTRLPRHLLAFCQETSCSPSQPKCHDAAVTDAIPLEQCWIGVRDMEAEAIVTARGTGRWSPQQTEQRCPRSRHRPPGLCVPLGSLGSAYSPQRHGAAPEATGGTVVASRVGGGGSRGCGFITRATAAWGPKAISLNVAWNQNRNVIFGTEPIEPRGRHSALELEESRASWNWTRGGPVYTASLPGSDSGAAASPSGSRPNPQGWQVALVPGSLVGIRGRQGGMVTNASPSLPHHQVCCRKHQLTEEFRGSDSFVRGRRIYCRQSTWDRSFQKVVQRSIGCG
ncbi:uncharacterized protein LOC102895581 [Pteropus alecto]|uniref:uncharacterized protein LOC102895581 n=1 Tax=Pteropus alecto TaxID=9402 RepID=UPI000D5335D3|nr:uncharacterized protein LOC102895581 [Pteropus alecto]XP_024901446.1 uncharacterized protein LOC102895581 [Pteropus alecto]